MPLRTINIKVLPYSHMNPKLINTYNTKFSRDVFDGGSSIDPNTICRGCHNPYKWCMERMWRKICLQQVVDYFEEVDFDGVTKEKVYKTYFETFLIMIRAEILARCGYYELGNNIKLPDCMKGGSLQDAYDMMVLLTCNVIWTV